MAMQRNRSVKTTSTSLRLLEAVKDLDGTTVDELVEYTGLARSTVYNHLQTLQEAEYVVKENNTFHVGLKIFHMGEYARTRKKEYELASEVVADLAETTGVEASWNVEEHGRITTVFDSVGGSTPAGTRAGDQFYMHNTAAGKAILAELSKKRRDEIIADHGLPGQTEKTITDRDYLSRELETVREQGYACNNEENITGYVSIATTIKHPDGRVLGALTVGGPSYILTADVDQEIVDTLFEATETMRSRLLDVLLE